jgi:hypothetical protein
MSSSQENANYYIDVVKAIYSVDHKVNKIKRINANVAPLIL